MLLSLFDPSIPVFARWIYQQLNHFAHVSLFKRVRVGYVLIKCLIDLIGCCGWHGCPELWQPFRMLAVMVVMAVVAEGKMWMSWMSALLSSLVEKEGPVVPAGCLHCLRMDCYHKQGAVHWNGKASTTMRLLCWGIGTTLAKCRELFPAQWQLGPHDYMTIQVASRTLKEMRIAATCCVAMTSSY